MYSSSTVMAPSVSSTPSSVVGTLSVAVDWLAAKVTVWGAEPEMYSPSWVTFTVTSRVRVRASGLPPCRCRVKVAGSPSATEAWSALMRTPMVLL